LRKNFFGPIVAGDCCGRFSRTAPMGSFTAGTSDRHARNGRCVMPPKTKSPPMRRAFVAILKNSGAGEGIRTLDPDLGKVVLYP
jgi:hypothetical protein